jgi:hypothetical protein
MKRRSNYVFGAALAGCAFTAVPGLLQKAHGALATAADFTFEQFSSSSAAVSSTQSGTFVTGVSFTAEVGTGTVYGFHSAGGTYTASSTVGGVPVTVTATALPTATVYSDPGGNGSVHALSSQNWAPGDYYMFTVPTTIISGIQISFDQTSSGTGPGAFSLLYSSDGLNYSTFTTYSIPLSGTSTIGFASGTSNTALSFSFDLSSITALNGDSSASFELQDASNVAYNSATTPFTSGSDRVDNFIVSGTSSAVPEPGVLSLMSVASATSLLRRRRMTTVEAN